ncbi:MAG: DNA-binding CsgD family transcriptional regulator [Myxococcota bacterium]|jgi:DNA-binding CsgD family transcriptional regulator
MPTTKPWLRVCPAGRASPPAPVSTGRSTGPSTAPNSPSGDTGAAWAGPLPEANVDLVFNAQWQVVSGAAEAADWLAEPSVLPALRAAVTARGAGWWTLTPLCLRVVEMSSRAGPMFLVTVLPPQHDRAGALATLTPTQRAVAEYAACGATTAEIGRTMGRSPETVRTHLKAVYQSLWVGSRIELARLLRPPAIVYGS